MCGIAGLIDAQRTNDERALTKLAAAMAEPLRHRGPDGAGEWVDPAAGVALGFRRLAIIDLSPTGDQPMASASGRYVMVFNGEVYNFQDLRRDLEMGGVRFRGRSDTEVLVELIAARGVRRALQDANGMFGLAVWDAAKRTLTLARDRFGEKPLFYGWMGSSFVFGSELKALWQHPDFRFEVDRESLTLYLRYGYVPAPRSILRGVAKVAPGSYVQVCPDRPGEVIECGAYWSLLEVAERGSADPVRIGEEDAVAELDRLLRESVARRMVADVPLGAFLSGGIDSSTVVALMQEQASLPVRTYTIGFEEFGFNEAEHAERVARHLRTEHTELYLRPGDALAVVPQLPAMYDEPFADASQIPTHLVSRLARETVTVALSGDGGDEVFGGYNRHVFSALHRRTRRLPRSLRHAAGRALTSVPPPAWDRWARRARPLMPRRLRGAKIGDKLHKVGEALSLNATEDVMRATVSRWTDPSAVVLGADEPGTHLTAQPDWGTLDDPTEQMLYLDSVTYLPDDILAKVDRAAMAVSLETRIPHLDPAVVEFAWRLPLDAKVRGRRGKWILRRVLDRYVPEELVLRPKSGFEMPLGAWLRGDLRDWAEGLVSEPRLAADGFLDLGPVRRAWEEHIAGRADRKDELWTILMFQAWHEWARASAGSR